MRLGASRPWLTGLLIPVVLGVMWEFAVRSGFTTGRLMPPPSHLLASGLALAQSGELWTHVSATMTRIGLGFLRKVCDDQHTTRTFEIPACGSMLIADRTDEHMAFFAEGKEAEYFDSQEELVEKVSFYSSNEQARAAIAAAGQGRCKSGRYAYIHRLRDALAGIDA